ncbi:Tankyrase-2 [Nymphon striatum]|nr:Tankyrase-2 [Nymphon striatum]
MSSMQEALETITSAVKSGRTDIVKSLIDACQQQDDSGDNDSSFTLADILRTDCTPYGSLLHWTTKLDDTDIVRTLLSAGADPCLRNKENETAVEFILSDKMMSVYNEELLRATAQSKVEEVEMLLDSGINVNCYDSEESMNTPLHWAASYSDVPTVKCLLGRGAEVNMTNASGTTALHDAIDRGDIDIIKLLLDEGASPLLKAFKGKFAGKNCLDLAIEKPQILSLLVQYSSKKFGMRNGFSENSGLKESPSLESLLSTSQDTMSVEKIRDKPIIRNIDSNLNKAISLNHSSDSNSNVKLDGPLQLLWPHPQVIKVKGGSFVVDRNINIAVHQVNTKGQTSNLNKVIKLWEEQKKCFADLGYEINVFGLHVGQPISEEDFVLTCHINSNLFKHINEYKLDICHNQVKLVANDEDGLYYGIQTFKQLINLYSKSEEGLPNLLIHDWPNTRIRAVLFDLSVRFRVPTLDYIKSMIDVLSSMKINQFHLYTRFNECVGWKHAYSPCDIISLDEYCQKRHIQLIPAVDVDHHLSLSDLPMLSAFLTKFSSCFSTSITLFYDSCIHIGPRLCSLLINPEVEDVMDDVYKYLSFTSAYSTIFMCANSFHVNLDVIKQLPPNTILLDYGFHANYDFNTICQKLSQNGYCVFPCTGTAAWNSLSGCPEAAIMNVYNAVCCMNNFNLSGMLIADWTGSGHITDALFNWPGFTISAEKLSYFFIISLSSISQWLRDCKLIIQTKVKSRLYTPPRPEDLLHDVVGDLINHHVTITNENNFSLGKIIMELGRIETFILRASRNQDQNDVSNLPSAAGSTLHQLLIDPDNSNLEHLSPEVFQRAIRNIKKTIAEVPKSAEVEEVAHLYLTIDLMLISCRIGKSLLLSGQNPNNKTGLSVVNLGIYNLQNTTKTDLANRLLELTDRYRNVWLSCNLPAGLQGALLLLSSLLRKLIPDSIPEDDHTNR